MEVRKKICIFELKKCERNIFSTPKLLENLKLVVDVDDPRVPTGICQTCRTSRTYTDILSKDLAFENFSVVEPNLEGDCYCLICSKFHEPFAERTQKLAQKLKKNPLTSFCTRCFKVYPTAKPHKCPKSSPKKTDKFEFICNILEKSPKFSQCVISHFLKQFVPTPPKPPTLKLSQFKGGQPLTVNIGPLPESKKVTVSADELIMLEKENNASYAGHNTSMRLAKFLNKKFGKFTMEKNFKTKYIEKTHVLSNESEALLLDCFFENKKKKIEKWEKKPAVVVKNFSDYVLKICHEKGWDPQECFVNFNIDRGQNSLKFVCSVINLKNWDGGLMTSEENEETSENINKNKYKDTGQMC